MKGAPGPRYYAYMATAPTGEMVMAIAHMGEDGVPALDEVDEHTVEGGVAGIEAVCRGMRAQGIKVDLGSQRATADTVRDLAIAGALRLAGAH